MLSWEGYASKFRAEVREADHRRRFDTEYVERCLLYAEPLYTRGLPVIYNPEHLGFLVGYRPQYLFAAANATERYYRSFLIPKATGGTRLISEPLPSLKEIQRWVLDEVLNKVPVHRFAKGFVIGRSVRDNARYHKDQQMVLRLDIKDFFGNIGFPRVLTFFLRLGYARSVSVLLARLCVLNGSLPQGAPTSAALSNHVVARIDQRLARFAQSQHIRYTRYADDLTFSGTFKSGALIRFVKRVINESGFELNDGKTRLMRRHEQQRVTGIVVNEKLQAPRRLRRRLRQAVYYSDKFGVNSHIEFREIRQRRYIDHLLGQLTFVRFVNPEDQHIGDLIATLRALRSIGRTE